VTDAVLRDSEERRKNPSTRARSIADAADESVCYSAI
jgi:hypothetical protein